MPRRPNVVETEKVTFLKDHAALTATTTVLTYKVPAGRTLRLDRASYVNPTGLVADAANSFTGTVKNGATVAATVFNTATTGGATLPVDTFVEGVLSATDASRVFQAGAVVSLVLTETGTATLPAGTFVLEGRLY